jgi:hypothetical protein
MAEKKSKQKQEKSYSIAPVVWKSKEALLSEIAFTPKNYKIKTDLGRERLQTSLGKFGLANSVTVNPFSPADMKKLGVTDLKGKKYVLIDGNSRVTEAMEKGIKKISISYPAKPLSIVAFREMSAMFDFAKAGEVDLDRIQGDLGSMSDFYKAWGLEIPFEQLEKMGSKADTKELLYPEEGTGKNGKKTAEPMVSDVRMVQLFFTEKQEAEFRKMEERSQKKLKHENTTDFVWNALKTLKL